MLSEAIDTYLKVRRTLGFKLFTAQGYLVSYARFAAKAGDVHMRTTTAIRWAKLGQSEASRAVRLNVLIRFARFAHAEERLHEVPPNHVFCHRRIRRHPYIFSDAEIVRILEQAQRLNPPDSLRPQTYSTLFGLLAATGMRISEALALRISDITPDGLIVRQAKFRKSRLVCLHDSVASAIGQYLVHRTKVVGADEHLFVSHRGGHPLGYAIAAETFQAVLAAAGVNAPPDRPRPRLHDLRHSFAVRALQTCPESRDRVAQHTLALTTYMGHAHVSDTYWYLDSTPQLTSDIASACEAYLQGGAS
ncbi:tyrosine-type recombinase/integrase [Candidatus Accumulibacter sp. ACC012]|jgi:integrase/recombinase XerD|uniref:tyrosine-type recombinase/integrase n=1 Tax=Candidatus Accumulibacter sp. ACC012 TaxID=2823332 RepID=UPI001B587573|nr:tyrosine-type recombinase/integrase [Candidatus Accumulibacter sp. ACC012]MBP9806323.1 tyrosine-type recombinase/integrase [Accumulibacter sp.]